VGVVKRDDALRRAQEKDLDLVEVAADANPPVCKLLDYSKYKYEQEQKAKAARRHQKQITVREMKMRPKIAVNDYETKKGHVARFLEHGDKVKITIMFRGREATHPERGEQLLLRLAEDVAELGNVEQRPIQDGRNMTMLLGPTRKKEDIEVEAPAEDEGPRQRGKDSRRAKVAAEKADARAGEHAKKPAKKPAEEPAEAAEETPAETPAQAPAETSAETAPAEPVKASS
jgi:translation initiation factor IF-3